MPMKLHLAITKKMDGNQFWGLNLTMQWLSYPFHIKSDIVNADCTRAPVYLRDLTHWDRDKMAAIF